MLTLPASPKASRVSSSTAVGGSSVPGQWETHGGPSASAPAFRSTRYHDLRHHLASELLGDGMSLPAVAGILGDTPGTVLAVYGHFVLADNDRPRATMRRLWTRTDEDLDTGREQLRTGEQGIRP